MAPDTDHDTTIQELEARVDALHRKVNELETLVIGPDRSLSEDQFQTAESVWDRLDAQEAVAETAMAVARADTGIKDDTEKGYAKRLARNKVVKDAVLGSTKDAGASIDTPELQAMAEPDVQLYAQQCRSAFRELANDHDCLLLKEGSGTKQGPNRRLCTMRDDVPGYLVRALANDLANEAVANKLLSRIDDREV